MKTNGKNKYLAFTGGVGGAKLCVGLSKILNAYEIAFVVNTGDDFIHLDFPICPDLDSLMYALSAENNEELGWGRKGETWNFLRSFAELGGENWFQLGDRDLAIHVMRKQLLREGLTLSEVTSELYQRFGISHAVLPMTNEQVATKIQSQGELKSFQKYFVREKCEPKIEKIVYHGSEHAKPVPAVLEKLKDPNLSGVIICPSNPFLSIDPILSLETIKSALLGLDVPVIAVSPIIHGSAVKGPTDKIMAELGFNQSALGVAEHYDNLITHFVLDNADVNLRSEIEKLGLSVLVCNTLMKTLDDKTELAENVIKFTKNTPI